MEIIMKKKNTVRSSRKWIDLCLMQWHYYCVPLSESDFVQQYVKSSDFFYNCYGVFSLSRAASSWHPCSLHRCCTPFPVH